MRKTAVLTATTVLVLAGGSTAYAFAAGSDDGATHDRAEASSAAAPFVRAHGHVLAVAAGDDHRSRQSEAGDDRGGSTRHVEPGDDRGGETRHVEPGDDRGGSEAESGDDSGGRHGGGEAEPGDDHGGHGSDD
jgi:hypothetical protein